MLNVKKFFDEDLPAALENNKEKVKSIGATFQLDIEGAGIWTIDCVNVACTSGAAPNPDCTIKLYSSDIETLLENPKDNALKLFFSGRMRILGNQILSANFAQVLGLVAPTKT